MNATTLADYLDTYGPLVADRARAAFEPLHVPSTDPVVQLDLRRPMLPAQAHVVTAAVKTLKRQKAIFFSCECGTGKCQMGACTCHAHAAGKPYRAIIMCPPHLLTTWQDELRAIFPPRAVDVWTLERWDELLLLPRGRLVRPLWLIMAETTAKMSSSWRPSAIVDRARGMLRCPDCGAEVRNKQGNFITLKELGNSKKRCTAEVPSPFSTCDTPDVRECGAALWQYADETGRATWAPADYIHKHLKGMFDYLVCDEAHQMKAEDSARSRAMGALVASVRKVVGMTGTLIGGKASHIRSLLFRMNAKSLRAEGLGWKDSMEFSRRYGRVDKIITEKEGNGNDNRRSRGKARSVREAEAPGVMPSLYGRHLIANTVFLSLKDVAKDLPSFEEVLIPVDLGPVLAQPYRDMEENLKSAIKELLKKGGGRVLLGKMLHCLLSWPDYPWDHAEIGYEDRGKNAGPHGRWVHVCQPPDLNRHTLWPKEKKLLEILATERAQGRQCWVFACYTDKHPVLDRLETIVQQAGFKTKVLYADKVPTKKRSEWIARNAPGVDVMISHPQPVGTGLTLFSPDGSHNFPTLCFYETGYDLFSLRQASRRSWRIGQRLPCHCHFLYYAETMQARAMALMARKLDASLALEGQFSSDGLAAMCADGGSLAMELAKSLVENVDFGETERVWAKVNQPAPKPPLDTVVQVLAADRPLTKSEQLVLDLFGGI